MGTSQEGTPYRSCPHSLVRRLPVSPQFSLARAVASRGKTYKNNKTRKVIDFFFLQNVNCELFLIELNIPFLSYFQLPFSKKLFPVFGAPKTPIRHCPYCCCCYILLVFVEHGKEGEDIEKI